MSFLTSQAWWVVLTEVQRFHKPAAGCFAVMLKHGTVLDMEINRDDDHGWYKPGLVLDSRPIERDISILIDHW
jgi:hypothetical protein